MSNHKRNIKLDELIDRAIEQTPRDSKNRRLESKTIELIVAEFEPNDHDLRRMAKYHFNRRFRIGPPTAESFGQLTFDNFICPYVPELLVRGDDGTYMALRDCTPDFIGADLSRARRNAKHCADAVDRKSEIFTQFSKWAIQEGLAGRTDVTFDHFVRSTARLDESKIIEIDQTDDDDEDDEVDG